jgi:hypothetical protein
MVVFTILTIIYHRVMHQELNGLTKTLPSARVREREAHLNGEYEETEGENEETDPLLSSKPPPTPPSGLAGLFRRFFSPQKYASFSANLAKLSNTRMAEPVPSIPEDKEAGAYLHPALSAKMPVVWVAKDKEGRAEMLMEELHEQVKVTNEGAWVDDKGNVHIKKDELRALPVWKDKIYY